jgi:hypothetical protein
MKKNRNHLLSAAFCLIACFFFLTACNRAEIENPEPEVDNSEKEAITTPESPTIINLLEGQANITTETEFELVGNTENGGTAQFVGQGLLLYTPAENATESTDRVKCRRRHGRDKPWVEFVIRVIIVKDRNSMPCKLGANPDFAFLAPDQASTIIDVLANDRFCNNRPDSSSLKIAIMPIFGKAEVTPVISTRQPLIRYSRTQNTPPAGGRDIFVYRVHELGNPNNVGYGVVVVNYGQNCRLKAVDDFLLMSPKDTTRKIIHVLRNDYFCPELMDSAEFKVVREPRWGKAVVTNDRKIVYKSNLPYIDIAPIPEKDEFKYQIKYRDGRKDSASVIIRYEMPQVCPAVLPQANDDKYIFRADTIKFDKIWLPVLRNDRFCPSQFNPARFTVTRKPEVGTAVVLNGLIQFIPPTNTWRGKVKFRYQICEGILGTTNSNCDDAEVEVEIGN